MISKNQLQHIIDDILFPYRNENCSFSLKDNIYIQINSKTYTEPIFNFSAPELTKMDLDHLTAISDSVESGLNPEMIDTPPNCNILKLIHFFCNEFYITNNIETDRHKRVISSSISNKYAKFLRFPIVDILVSIFKLKMNCFEPQKHTICFTCDYDMTDLWTKLGFLRSMKRLTFTFFTFNFQKFNMEIKSYFNSKKEIADNLILTDNMFEFSNPGNFIIKNIAFWHILRNNPKYDDKNMFGYQSVQTFTKRLKQKKVEFGLHPAYDSASNPLILKKQADIFNEIFTTKIISSRFHYLKYQHPEDYKHLENLGIKKDYSYCFNDSMLFRGGRTFPTKLWSFEENRVINVISYPISIMDVVFKYYLNADLDKSVELAKQKINLSLKYGSHTVLLWHNNYLYKQYEHNNFQPELLDSIKNHIFSLNSQ